jgi:O-succinylbenzoate synthase
VGDAAPLPGFSQETLEEVKAETAKPDWWETTRLPSLRFAVECARFGLTWPQGQVQVNALWWAEEEPLDELLQRLAGWHRPVVKIKPGRNPDPQRWVQLCRERPDLRIRLDPNRGWSVAELRDYVREVPAGALDYVEEPLADLNDLRLLSSSEQVPVALDESLRERSPAEVLDLPGVRALVLKPSLMGNAQDRAPWVALAEKKGWDLVWSSSFESGVGIWHLARLAQGSAAAGLDTAAALAQDVVTPRPLSEATGEIRLSPWRLGG